MSLPVGSNGLALRGLAATILVGVWATQLAGLQLALVIAQPPGAGTTGALPAGTAGHAVTTVTLPEVVITAKRLPG